MYGVDQGVLGIFDCKTKFFMVLYISWDYFYFPIGSNHFLLKKRLALLIKINV